MSDEASPLVHLLNSGAMIAILVVALGRLRARFPEASMLIAAGAGTKLAFVLLRWAVWLPVSPFLETTICYVLIGAGLLALGDARAPVQNEVPRTLRENHRFDRADSAPRLVFVGLIALTVLLGAGRLSPMWIVSNLGALTLLTWASLRLERTRDPLSWILRRRAQLVSHFHAQRTDVVKQGTNEKTGTLHTLEIGLTSGETFSVELPADALLRAQAELAELCPQAAAGFGASLRKVLTEAQETQGGAT
jgi:hypothetical protein